MRADGGSSSNLASGKGSLLTHGVKIPPRCRHHSLRFDFFKKRPSLLISIVYFLFGINETQLKLLSESHGSGAVFQSEVDLASLPDAIDWRENVSKIEINQKSDI